MNLIQNITADAKQKQTLLLPDQSSMVFSLEYKPMQTGWFFTQITQKSFVVNNLRVVTGPNILHQFRNEVPFGIACIVDGAQEPLLQEDFLSGRAQLYLLSFAEIQQVSRILSGLE